MILLKNLNEKMKKVLFFMVLLFLIVLGTANVNAQVRIGGNTAPQGAAVLDLNADNTATPAANKGALALPRVSLASTTAQLNGTTPITGMLVWNTNTTLGAGIYTWTGSIWKKIDTVPAATPADSGLFLMSTGTSYIPSGRFLSAPVDSTASVQLKADSSVMRVLLILDTTVQLSVKPNSSVVFPAPGINYSTDWCLNRAGSNPWLFWPLNGRIRAIYVTGMAISVPVGIRCYRFTR